MATDDLAAERAIAAAMAAEAARQSTHSPVGGDECGVLLSDASPAELAALGMSPAAHIPGPGEPGIGIPPDWITQAGEAPPPPEGPYA